jgi:hypothetical protein
MNPTWWRAARPAVSLLQEPVVPLPHRSPNRSNRWTSLRRGGLAAVTAAVAAVAPMVQGPICQGIEMFTYYGDGSRIGLPSLEVPIEAYRGIPLRSDRLRARRAAQRNPGTSVQVGTPGMPREPASRMTGSMTIRTMPQLPAQAGPTAVAPAGSSPPASRRASSGSIPVAPDPDALLHRN